jgi:hypothetical protein
MTQVAIASDGLGLLGREVIQRRLVQFCGIEFGVMQFGPPDSQVTSLAGCSSIFGSFQLLMVRITL